MIRFKILLIGLCSVFLFSCASRKAAENLRNAKVAYRVYTLDQDKFAEDQLRLQKELREEIRGTALMLELDEITTPTISDFSRIHAEYTAWKNIDDLEMAGQIEEYNKIKINKAIGDRYVDSVIFYHARGLEAETIADEIINGFITYRDIFGKKEEED